MPKKNKTLGETAAIEALLSASPSGLSSENVRHLLELFTRLEEAALDQQDALASLASTEEDATLSPAPWWAVQMACPESVHATLRLARQIVRTARAQTRRLHSRAEAMSLLVLINPPRVARKLWLEIAPDFKAPVLAVQFLCELLGLHPGEVLHNGRSLAGHWVQFQAIQERMEKLALRRPNSTAVSDALENEIIPWLDQLDAFLRTLHVDKAA